MEVNQNRAYGNVFVYNVTPQDVRVSTNGLAIAGEAIAGWSWSGSAYAPGAQAVPRTLDASDGPGKFFSGTNNVMLETSLGFFTADVALTGIPLNQDLLLFVQSNQWQLVNEFGEAIASGSLTSQTA